MARVALKTVVLAHWKMIFKLKWLLRLNLKLKKLTLFFYFYTLPKCFNDITHQKVLIQFDLMPKSNGVWCWYLFENCSYVDRPFVMRNVWNAIRPKTKKKNINTNTHITIDAITGAVLHLLYNSKKMNPWV